MLNFCRDSSTEMDEYCAGNVSKASLDLFVKQDRSFRKNEAIKLAKLIQKISEALPLAHTCLQLYIRFSHQEKRRNWMLILLQVFSLKLFLAG